MIASLIGACETLAGVFTRKRPAQLSRVSRVGMPNGFFMNDLLWFGDGASKRTAISRGFIVEPGEISAFSVTQLNDLHERLRILLGILGEEFALQIQWSIDSDYRHELEAYQRETLKLRRQDPIHGQFGVLIRAERYERYKAAMEEGRLRRERLTLFFTRVIDTKVPVAGDKAVAEYFEALSRKESQALCEFAMGALSRLFSDCRITPMRDRDHFLMYYRFLNTNLQSTAIDPTDLLDPGYSIQRNCLHGEGIAESADAGVSFKLDCYHHAIFAVRQWPRRTFPGIVAALTGMGFQEYSITMNVYPKRVEKVIEKEEQYIQRLQIDAMSERKQSLVTDMVAKQEKVAELQQGKVIPLNALFVVRLWHRKPEQLAARCASLKNAFISMGGATVHHATIPENARQLFYQTWPGWTYGTYRAFDLPAEDVYLADLIPWSATFTGHLENAEAIYNGARGNLVGIRMRLGNTPQHGVLFGMTGAGKSVIIADLLAQIGHRFGFRLIVEEGLSHSVLTQTQGCQPVVVNPDGHLTINYLDTCETPLSPTHLAFSAGLCMLFCGNEGLDGERKAMRHAMIVENLQQLYTDFYNDWIVANEQAAEDLRWRAAAIDRYLKIRMRASHSNFVDAFAAFRDWEVQNTDEAADFVRELPENAVVEFAKSPGTTNLVRDLAFAYFRPEQFPSHSALIEQLLFNPRGGTKEREECDRVGKLLRAWSRDGEKGRLFDGVSNIRIDGRVAHFELGQIPEHATEMRAAANFLVANYGRQKIITMPRSVPKIAIFEEAARTLEIPGGVRMVQEYYRQMRKFGCNILAVVQQYDVLRNSEARGAIIGNSKMFLVTSQQSREDAKEIGEALNLSDKTVETINSYPLPELMDPRERFSAFTYVANDKIRRLVGTVKNVASRELLYAAASDNETFDRRTASLGNYQNIVTGIIEESEKLLSASEESATKPIL
jgi:type IV secretion system protein TrbE